MVNHWHYDFLRFKKRICLSCGEWGPLIDLDGEDVCEICACKIIKENPEAFVD